MAGSEVDVSSAPTMLFISIVIGATILILTWLIRRDKEEPPVTTTKPSKQPKRKEPKVSEPRPSKPQPKAQKPRKKPPKDNFTHPELLASLKGHGGNITSGDFSADGKHFITAADVGSGRRFDPGGRRGKKNCNANLLALEDSLDLSSISDGSSSLAEADSSSVSSGSQMANSNAPSDVEEVFPPCKSSKMPGRSRKNKNKNNKHAKKVRTTKSSSEGLSDGQSAPKKPISRSTKLLFESLEEMNEEDLYKLLLPKCCVAEDRVLNGYPYATNFGVFVFKPNGYTTLAGVLNGSELLEVEMNAIEREELHKTLDVEGSSDYSEPESLEDLSVGDTYQDDNHESSSGVSSDSKDTEADMEGNYISDHSGNVASECKSISRSIDLNFDSTHRTYQNLSEYQQVEKCKRCRKPFSVSDNGSDTCEYHPKKIVLRRDGRLHYQCCNRMKGVAGCTQTSLHVFHHLRLGINGPLGYLNTRDGTPRVFGLDCEMVFTSKGFELARITMVCVTGIVVLDLYVKPIGEVYDYNTKFSGITAEHMANAVSFAEAQERVLDLVSSSSILVGHSLEGDLAALQLIHRNVIDTALLFKPPPTSPTFSGPVMHKQSLKSLAKKHLDRDIQKGGNHGHNSLEDATAALDLVLNYIKESHFVLRRPPKVAPLPLALRDFL